MTRPSDAHVRAMPKVELHVHIEGAAPASTVAALARRHGIDLGVDDPSELYHYRDLADFLRVFDLVCRCLRTRDDVHRVAYDAMAIAATTGVRYREVMCSPSFGCATACRSTRSGPGLPPGCAMPRPTMASSDG